jgi:branched-subunit amino acid aminotransferase/4-amino-4-deoxychorismate lyase
MNDPQAYLNGHWIPAVAAAIPLDDAGFVQGATVAEQLRTFGGRIFRLEEHLARLHHSLDIVGIDPGMTAGEFAAVALELVARNHRLLAANDDMGLSIVVTPGTYPAYATSAASRPTVCLHTYPLPFHLWAEKYDRGQSLVTTDVRQVPACCWPPSLKCRSRMHYYLADRQAAASEPGARALLLDEAGLVTEASTANVLAYRGGEGLISPRMEGILHGISLAVAFDLAAAAGIPTVERDLSVDDLIAADEVLLSSTPLCLLPVTRINGRPIGCGTPGPAFGRLLAAWGELVGLDIAAQARRFASRPAH